MDKEMLEQFQLLFSAIEEMRSETKSEIKASEERMQQALKASEARLEDKIKASEARTKVFIENTVSKRIDALFDGYKLTHEKQWELEHETRRLQEQVSDLQTRLEALEKKVSA